MKNFLSIILSATLCLPLAAVAAEFPSQVVTGQLATSISDNGRWVIGQADGEGYLYIRDLVNGVDYYAGGNLTSDGSGYIAGLGKTIANDGTAIALLNGLPFYWKPTGGSGGTWKPLPGDAVDGSAVVGSISPEGDIIVGGCGNTGTTIEDIVMTNPCIWYRQPDGSYGEPVYLPYPQKDLFGMVPQHVKCIAVSEDGKVISAMMTSGNGFYEIPYIYTCDSAGEWSYKDVGSPLINPNNLVFPGFPPELTIPQPNPWGYLNDEQQDAFMAAFPEWAQQPPQNSLKDNDFLRLQWLFMAEFMDERDREMYLMEYEDYFEEYDIWNEKNEAYTSFMQSLNADGINFLENNSCLSPDGKYAYFTGMKTFINDPSQGELGVSHTYTPLRVDVNTGEIFKYENATNNVLTSVAADYSVLCRNVGLDSYWPGAGWIYPEGKAEGMTIPDFILEKGTADAYTWMEDNMYMQVITGVNASGNYIYDDSWVVGTAYCTPDLSVLACANSTMYWDDPFYEKFFYVSFIVSNGSDSNSTGSITESAGAVWTELYDLSGVKVFEGSRIPGLPAGIYIARQKAADGSVSSKKLLIK